MLKKIFSILIMILLLVGLSGNVFAKDTYTATSTINGVTVNWEYEVNETNQIENLKCTNPTALIGNITIPSTLDGKTVVSLGSNAFKSATGITEITIPSSVKEIEYSAFDNCTKLNKVTILDNVEKMGFYNIDDKDSIFKNHNGDLTIYCYKDSMAANYALKYNIKYVYLTKPSNSNPSTEDSKKDDTEIPKVDTPTDTKKDTNVKDTTVATGKLPQTGATMTGLFIIIIISIVSTIFYVKYRKFRDIK